MKLSEIRRLCEPYDPNDPYRGDTRNETLCKVIAPVDEGFIYPVDRDILTKDRNGSLLDNIDVALKKLKMEQNILRDDLGCNTWPYGKMDDKNPRFLAICRGNSKLANALKAIQNRSKKIATIRNYPDKLVSPMKTVILLTDKWDFNTFMEYEIDFLNHALRDGIWYIFLLVTEYGYTQIPFLPNNRNALKGYSNEDVEGDFTNDVKNLLPYFEYDYYDITRKQNGLKTYMFHIEDIMWWKKISNFEENDHGRIPDKALLKFIQNVLWIKDSGESRIEPKSINEVKEPICRLRIFGKEVNWHPVSKDNDKVFGELTESMEKFIEKCDKKWRK